MGSGKSGCTLKAAAYPSWAFRNHGANKVLYDMDKYPIWEVRVDGTGDVCADCRKLGAGGRWPSWEEDICAKIIAQGEAYTVFD